MLCEAPGIALLTRATLAAPGSGHCRKLGGTMPIDNETLAYLVEEEVVEEGTTLEDAQKFIENQLKAEEIYDFFAASRKALMDTSKRKKKAKA